MESALALHRLHFAFTVTYHYLFPQLTMGLAPLIVLFKTLALWKKDERYDRASRFWAKIFAINFFFGVITGVPMEFQFGTNWARFSQYSGGVIATALAMEGVFAFFLESSFLGIFLSYAVVGPVATKIKTVREKKLYPGYIMIQMLQDKDAWFLVRETPGIGDFLGLKEPIPMAEHMDARLRQTDWAA